MKLTKKITTKEVETTETVCEIAQEEFDQICAKTTADVITDYIGKDADVDDLIAGVMLTSLFAQFVSNLDDKLFDNDNTENPDKKEEK
jgi:hypothetical protein